MRLLKISTIYSALLLACIFAGCGVKSDTADDADARLSPEESSEAALNVEQEPMTQTESGAGEVHSLESEDDSSVRLRGYGVLSSDFEQGNGASLLKIKCESLEKAQLTQAKYLSDLEVLPGVSELEVLLSKRVYSARKVEDQGVVMALQKGAEVWIFSGDTLKLMALAILNKVDDLENWSSVSTAEVPMWLDRWDQFGFRFYYRPWALPSGVNGDDYDYANEFAFAEENGRSGFMFWENMNPIHTAEGLTNSSFLDFAREAARERSLPVGLNIMVGGAGNGWLFNPYREETQIAMPQYSGSFKNPGDGYLGQNGYTSWNSVEFQNVQLGLLQKIISDYVENDPNLTSVLEPHGELRHGLHDIFMEYGPVADSGFRRYLEGRYENISAVNARWETDYTSFEEVRVPEVASFLGWGPDALDLAGVWKVKYEPLPAGESLGYKDNRGIASKLVPTLGAPKEWFAEDFDDSDWLEFEAPATDDVLFIEQRPAVVRQTIDVPAEWFEGKKQVWLYVWDLNRGPHDVAKLYMNGQFVGEDTVVHPAPHWMALDVTQQIRVGQNQVSLRLPKAMIAYRIYLSPDAPHYYPNLGMAQNALWVDFIDWMEWSREEVVQRGMDMIRQVAPNRPIVMMAPDGYESSALKLARNYGGNFHNTGYMGAFYADYLPSLMRGAGLPFSLEPGGPASDLPGFKKQFGLYTSEGLQGIDYFIHIGSILWNDEMRQFFVENNKLFKLFGKYHGADTDVAAFYSSQIDGYTGYPWPKDYNMNLKSGYWNWNPFAYLRGIYAGDGLSESSFDAGDAEKYRVILDSNTSIMTDTLLEDIEAYVRDGGIYVTSIQTGRHTLTEPNTWPIAQLTGFEVTHIDELDSQSGRALTPRTVHPAPGQSIFKGDWSYAEADGLTLKAVAEDAQALMLWDDGSVAVGMRPLGKGYIVQLGCKFVPTKFDDRLSYRSNVNTPKIRATRALYTQLLEWQQVPQVPAVWEPNANDVRFRHYVSNNGLYDVWTVWNPNESGGLQGHIQLKESDATWGYRAVDGSRVNVVDGRLDLKLEPLETQVFLTPRNQLENAALEWLELQQKWWRSTVEISDTNYQDTGKLELNVVDLQADWAFLPLTGNESVEAMAQPAFNDSRWDRLPMEIWNFKPGYESITHALMRKEFTVPAEWTEGDIELWLYAWFQSTFVGEARVWLDGQLIRNWSANGIDAVNPDGVLKAGTSHTLAVEIKSKGHVAGIRGSVWIRYNPNPLHRIDLSGDWLSSQDMMSTGASVSLPGPYSAMSLKRNIEIPSAYEGKRVLLNMQRTGSIIGLMINGHWLRRFHHQIGDEMELDITPWVHFGERNSIEIIAPNGVSRGEIKSVELRIENSPNG